jgi:NitT/TauT family transport system substrate-binding protein
MTFGPTRRGFLVGLSGIGAALLGRPSPAAEGTLETTAVRFMRTPAICHAPQFVAETLLHAEGFTEVRFIDAATSAEINAAVAGGKIDFNLHFAPQWVSVVDGGGPITVLAGVHVGCFELFGNERIRTVADLKGRTVGVPALGSSDHLFVSVIAAHIGLDPVRDIRWVASPSRRPLELFAEGRSTRCSGSRRCRRRCAPGASAMSSSTARSTSRGRNISAACWPATGISSGPSRWRRNACCAPS